MYKTIEVGNYNINYLDEIYQKDGKNLKVYEMVMIEKFNGNEPVENFKKVLYFRKDKGFTIPSFKTEKDVEKYLKYKNYSRIKVELVESVTTE